MKPWKPAVAIVAIAFGAFTLTAGHAAPTAIPSAASEDGPDIDSMPQTMTEAEMDAIPESAELAIPADSPHVGAKPLALAADHCTLVSGKMWKRSSGQGHPYGTVGSKPQLINCTSGVVKTHLHSAVWMNNGWIWFQAAGPFDSYGTGNMTQKSVQYICKGTGKYPFKVLTIGYGTNSRGASAIASQNTDEFKFSCG